MMYEYPKCISRYIIFNTKIYHTTTIFVLANWMFIYHSFTIHLPFIYHFTGDSKSRRQKTGSLPDLPRRQREIGRVKGELLTGETTRKVLGKSRPVSGHVRSEIYDETW
jgi:hypothetical protein